ncbi:MAG: hypothetical protein IKU43_06190 [Clostridia bacterium]|nr:hypothetical protein [Clostridia bacterium]
MNIIEKLKRKFSKNDETSPAFRHEFAEKINNRHVKYVTERFEGIEEIVGREGHINILPDGIHLAVTCGITEIFKAKIDDLSMWTLMSNDGVVLDGFDLVTGRKREVTAFYLYYR